MYQNCISSKPIGSVWKIKHDHSDDSGSSLTSVRISSYIEVKFGFLFYLKHSFLEENYKSFGKKMIRNIWLYTKNCCSSRSRIFGNLINLKGLLVNMSLCRFSIKIERLSLQELRISLAEIIVTPLGLKHVQ